tara:strand:+ start:413 stop:1711 length:1299 start_codon:yes stop_codon:yes gene_type:complete
MKNKLIFGVEKFIDGIPIDNCIEYTWNEIKPCDTELKIREWNWPNNDFSFKEIGTFSEPYVYPICMKSFDQAFSIDDKKSESCLDYISELALDDLKSGKSKLFIFHGYEGPSISDGDTILKDGDVLIEKLEKIGISSKNVIYCDANLNLPEYYKDIKLFGVCDTANTFWKFNMENTQNTYHVDDGKGNYENLIHGKSKIRPYYYLCYNRLPKDHRAYFITSLFNNDLIERGLVSFPSEKLALHCQIWPGEYLSKEHLKWDIDTSRVEELKSQLPFIVDKKRFENNYSETFQTIENYLDTYVNIVTESRCSDFASGRGDSPNLSEKTWKPIMNFHPFIIVGNKGVLKKLREFGFDVFDDFFDNSYDELDGVDERILAITNQIKRICNMNLDDLHKWYWSVFDRLENNYYNYYENFVPKNREYFIKNIMEFIND